MEIKKAKWIHDEKNDLAPGLWTSYKCSNCGEPVTVSIAKRYKYCPMCGRNMKMEKEEEEWQEMN